jgi:hypothetical protein
MEPIPPCGLYFFRCTFKLTLGERWGVTDGNRLAWAIRSLTFYYEAEYPGQELIDE